VTQVLKKPIDVPVLIVGAGPVGLTLSIELSARGVRNMVLGEALVTSEHPKCNTTNARSMEHFRRLGLSQKIRFGGLPGDYPTDIVYLTRLGGDELTRIKFPSASEAADSTRTGAAIWPTPEPQHRISQIFLEKILLEDAQVRRLGDIRMGWRVTDFVEQEDAVLVRAEELATRQIREISCRHLVGCDGARSTIRKCLNINLVGEAGKRRDIFGGTMIATYYESPDLRRILRGREGFMYWTLNSEIRSVTVAIDGQARFLTHFQVPEGYVAETADPSDFLPVIVGQPIAYKVLSSAVWKAGFQLVAERFGTERVFLAGDAAHLFTPTGGFGMNTGIDDIANLAWKLAAVEQGWGGPHLLNTYDIERRPIGHRNTTAASKIADVIAGFKVPSDIESPGEAGRIARADVAQQMALVSWEEFQTIGVQLGVRYETSPIIVPDGTAPLPDLSTRYVASARPGARLPHFYFADGISVYDRIGDGFTLINLSGVDEDDSLALTSARAKGVPLRQLMVLENNVESLMQGKFLLVRPDQHVAWRGNDLPHDFYAILDRARGVGINLKANGNAD
jgi:2-polyprenyl-6-methoxyphenol hydroxylase-like FAD-dependent oxidoreductase